MTFKTARMGDVCSHGAVIITGDNTRLSDDKKVARLGDLVSCPIHGLQTIISRNAEIVYNGDKRTAHYSGITSCGATIITGSENLIIDRTPDTPDKG